MVEFFTTTLDDGEHTDNGKRGIENALRRGDEVIVHFHPYVESCATAYKGPNGDGCVTRKI